MNGFTPLKSRLGGKNPPLSPFACLWQEKDTKGGRVLPPFCKWFDRLTILSLPKEGDGKRFRKGIFGQ
jgi:hypothetical protein